METTLRIAFALLLAVYSVLMLLFSIAWVVLCIVVLCYFLI